MQHLALFVPWESFLSESSGDINDIWERQRRVLSRRVASYTDNVQLLRRSAEDVKRDARQWAALSGDPGPAADLAEPGLAEGEEGREAVYRADDIGSATRLIDVLRNMIGGT